MFLSFLGFFKGALTQHCVDAGGNVLLGSQQTGLSQ